MIGRIAGLLLAPLLIASALGTLAACSTVEGLGKDIKAGGAAIRDEAKEIKQQF